MDFLFFIGGKVLNKERQRKLDARKRRQGIIVDANIQAIQDPIIVAEEKRGRGRPPKQTMNLVEYNIKDKEQV